MLTIKPFKRILNDTPRFIERDYIEQALEYIGVGLSYDYNYVKDIKRYFIFKRLYDEQKEMSGFIHILKDNMTWLELCELVYTIGYFPVYRDLSGMITMNEIHQYEQKKVDNNTNVFILHVRGSSGVSWVVERVLNEKDSRKFIEIMNMLKEAREVTINE